MPQRYKKEIIQTNNSLEIEKIQGNNSMETEKIQGNIRMLQRRIQDAIGMSPVNYRLMLTRDLK